MSRDQIISELYTSKEIGQALRKMQPAHLREELKQEMFVSLCSISDEKFWHLHENKALKFWLVRCMLNMIYSTGINQPFFKNFRHQHEELHTDRPDVYTQHVTAEEERNHLEALYDQMESKRAELTWYENELLNTWTDLNFNQKEISRKTGIPYMSVVKTISVIKQKLRDE